MSVNPMVVSLPTFDGTVKCYRGGGPIRASTSLKKNVLFLFNLVLGVIVVSTTTRKDIFLGDRECPGFE